MILTTYRRYRTDKYTYLESMMTGGHRNLGMVISMFLSPGHFRVEWKRGRS